MKSDKKKLEKAQNQEFNVCLFVCLSFRFVFNIIMWWRMNRCLYYCTDDTQILKLRHVLSQSDESFLRYCLTSPNLSTKSLPTVSDYVNICLINARFPKKYKVLLCFKYEIDIYLHSYFFTIIQIICCRDILSTSKYFSSISST